MPDPQAESTFEESKLRWDEVATAPHDGLDGAKVVVPADAVVLVEVGRSNAVRR